MAYRTKTYIAGDWDGDKDAIDQLYKWKESKYLSLDFVDAHDLHRARDTSLNCSIKKSLQLRLDVSKRFVLIVGEKTKNLRSGGCQLCSSYNSWTSTCARGYRVDYRSYVEYECEKAKSDGLAIVVLTIRRELIGTSVRIASSGSESTWQCSITKMGSAVGTIGL